MLLRRINIFLLSFFIAISPISSYALDPIVSPFTSAPAAADVAAALGAGETGGFAASAAGIGGALAAVGVGVGAFCIASAVQGANMCGVSTPICNALTGAMISCSPNPDGSFKKVKPQSNPNDPPDAHKYLYARADNVWKTIGGISADINAEMKNPLWHVETLTFQPTTEPYTQSTRKDVRTSDGYVSLEYGGLQHKDDTNPPPKPEADENATPNEVGAAVAGSPAAAAAVGAAAAAASGVGTGTSAPNCSGSMGTFNGVATCVPALGASKNPSCTGFYGVVNGQSVCVPPLGAGANAACSGYSGTVNGETKCIPEIGNNPACNGYFGTFNGSPVCVGGTDTSGYNPLQANADAINAAQAAALHPPASRTCPSNFKLDVTGVCINTTIPPRGNGDCKIGYVFYGNTCSPADPLNPSRPATTTPVTSAQAQANAAAAAASTSLTQAKANARAAAADAAANPTDQTKAAAAVAAAAALQQATLDAVAANTAATAEATSKPKPADLPAFCGWAAIVCDAIAWAKTEAKAPTDTAVSIKNDTPSDLQNFDMNKKYFNFGSQCPADVPISFSILGKSTTLNFKYTAICDFLGKIRPFVIGSAWIAGAFIISGSSRKGGED